MEDAIVFKVPDEAREAWFEFSTIMASRYKAWDYFNQNVDIHSDPLVIIRDLTVFSKPAVERILSFVERHECPVMTEEYFSDIC